MTSKRKLDYRKVSTVILSILLLLIGIQTVRYKSNRTFTQLEIKIDQNRCERLLIKKADVLNIMRSHLNFDPSVKRIKDIDFYDLEKKLKNHPFISKVSIYIDGNNVFLIDIVQKRPIARVKTKNKDFYIAEDGQFIPTSKVNTLRVPIIGGNTQLLEGGDKEAIKFKKNFMHLIHAIEKDKVLNALVEMIEIDAANKINFIPKIGREKIIYGDLEDQKEKLEKLKKYYEYGRKQDGWNKYSYFNLEYKNQIALGYEPH